MPYASGTPVISLALGAGHGLHGQVPRALVCSPWTWDAASAFLGLSPVLSLSLSSSWSGMQLFGGQWWYDFHIAWILKEFR